MDDVAGLWPFTLRLYGRPGVPEACLDIQDRHQADVTLLIFAAWVGAVRRAVLSPEQAAQAVGAVGDWHAQIVRPLRAVRRRMKTGPAPAPDVQTESLRDSLKAVEIGAERIELAVLESFGPPQGGHPAAPATRANLLALLALSAAGGAPGAALPPETAAALDILVREAILVAAPQDGTH